MNTIKTPISCSRVCLVSREIDQITYEIMLEPGREHDIKHIVMGFAEEIGGAF